MVQESSIQVPLPPLASELPTIRNGDAEHVTRRLRDTLYKPYSPKDEELPALVKLVSSLDRGEGKDALAKVWLLTLPSRENGPANQEAFAEQGGIAMLVDYAEARLSGGVSSEDEEEMALALLVLENLSCNTLRHRDMALDPNLIRVLITLIRAQEAYAIRANAMKVLVNLTFSDVQLQQAVASSGVLPLAAGFLHQDDPGLVRQAVWLLSNLTAGQGCAARAELAKSPGVLSNLKELLHRGDSPTKVYACEVICNLARGDTGTHADLLRVGAMPMLLGLINPHSEVRNEPEVVAPALLALAALAVGNSSSAQGLLSEAQLLLYLAGVLEYSNLVSRNYDLARVMVACHTLIFALGSFAARNKAKDQSNQPFTEVVQESGYVQFKEMFEILGLQKPQYYAACLGKDLGGPQSYVANATYQVNVELLPVLKHDNARMVVNACARLYQIATCLADDKKGRAVLTNAALVSAVRDLLYSEHNSILQVALSVVDALASLPEVVPLLVAHGVMDAVSQLGDENQPHPTNGGMVHDPLVLLLADRALVTMYVAQATSDSLVP
ncbi:MTD sexual regulator [Gonium pectorale]|uniref:Vacuolar protein 8 n=1 Tax=Gonium pectorale TaxID=33097 RepID=D0VXE1_GONPE|nr:MTD sexual regulator [Gonium pectorale]BAI49487.1 mating type minus specific gene product [Gonium pectorale]BAU61585.1 mating type minus specific gene product [Gonium pectorale]|eukprot:KXZ57089.1 MTD sexual regulator [Gonium pectorale]